MAYTPDPDRRPALWPVAAWALAFGALFTFGPAIGRALFHHFGA